MLKSVTKNNLSLKNQLKFKKIQYMNFLSSFFMIYVKKNKTVVFQCFTRSTYKNA